MNFEISNSRLKLFSNSILVKGARRCLILDLQRRKYDLIPNSLATILSKHSGEKFIDIYKKYSDYKESLNEYFEFLLKNEHLILNELIDNFTGIDLAFSSFGEVTNCIIDADNLTISEYKSLIKQLIALNCFSIQLRFYDEISSNKLKTFLSQSFTSPIRCFDLILKYSENLEREAMPIAEKYQRIRQLVLHSADKDDVIHFGIIGQRFIVKYKDQIKNVTHCGEIFNETFIVNTQMYIEAKSHNTCLNRKISIDVDGNIKNCPSMSESFGNIKDTTLQEALEKSGFKKYWNITKDNIEVCKDCEFRHICTDCRAYTENPDDMYSKPLKCGYNPYTCEWEEWSTNPLKQKAIDFYGMREMVKQQNPQEKV